ncbi:MAG: hypothetical protein P4L56_13675 [Candidatus Sulfopaludibacter sp.]|nr:hypothetical protein [Candidatus Sulfopaludibacter sp.]
MISRNDGVIGVSDHGGWAVLVTVAGDGTLLDRRRVELVDEDLPKIPHHSEGQGLPLHEAVALVERVRESAERHAKLGLEAVAMTVPWRILGVALRQCPALPPTIAERIKDYRAQNVADWVMYRKALAAAAEARGWAVFWYDAKKVFEAASEALRIENLDAHFLEMRRSIGPPWGKDHKVAMAAAMVAAKAASCYHHSR